VQAQPPGATTAGGALPVRPTLKAVAEAAKVSVATASLALRNSPRCAGRTRRLVARVAEQLGYTPDPHVARLMSYLHRSNRGREGATLAYITAFAERDGWRGLHTWERYFAGARSRAQSLGYRLEEFSVREPGMSEQRLSTILHTRGIAGLIIAPLPDGVNRLNLEWNRFASVAVGFSLQEPQIHRVAHNHIRSMAVALEHVRRCGYRRAGLVMSRTHDARVERHWTSAFLGHQRDVIDAGALVFDTPVEVERLLGWFRREKPDVIISDILTVPWHLEHAGFRVPRDFAFVHLNVPGDHRELAGIDQRSERVGEAAVKQLVAALHGNEFGLPRLPDTTLVCGEWIEGLSLPNAAATAKPPVAIAPIWDAVKNMVVPRTGIEDPEVIQLPRSAAAARPPRDTARSASRRA
jgi:DNA-binding LacI/PurR family transcriptional regulator